MFLLWPLLQAYVSYHYFIMCSLQLWYNILYLKGRAEFKFLLTLGYLEVSLYFPKEISRVKLEQKK